jgi:histone-lysine N-methyltransferase SETMAR
MEDAKVLVMYWYEKGHGALRIYQKLSARVGGRFPSYSTITHWLRRLRRNEDITRRASGSGRLAFDEIDSLIADALDEAPFHSVRSLASSIKYPHTTVWRHLRTAGYIVRNLHLVPHTLSPAQKAQRVTMAIELQQMVRLAKHRSWRYFLTGDESWFYFAIDHDHMWLPEGAHAPTRPRRTIASPKRMLTVFWSPLGFSLVEILPKGERFNAEYFCLQILAGIVDRRPVETAEDMKRKMVLHFDNASPHTARLSSDYMNHNRLKRAPQPPFSPDLAPSDFYLFGKVKTALMGATFEDAEQLLQAVMAVLNGISRDELERVFEEWLVRLDACVQQGGDYVE